jgi:hypothetical protein
MSPDIPKYLKEDISSLSFPGRKLSIASRSLYPLSKWISVNQFLQSIR